MTTTTMERAGGLLTSPPFDPDDEAERGANAGASANDKTVSPVSLHQAGGGPSTTPPDSPEQEKIKETNASTVEESSLPSHPIPGDSSQWVTYIITLAREQATCQPGAENTNKENALPPSRQEDAATATAKAVLHAAAEEALIPSGTSLASLSMADIMKVAEKAAKAGSPPHSTAHYGASGHGKGEHGGEKNSGYTSSPDLDADAMTRTPPDHHSYHHIRREGRLESPPLPPPTEMFRNGPSPGTPPPRGGPGNLRPGYTPPPGGYTPAPHLPPSPTALGVRGALPPILDDDQLQIFRVHRCSRVRTISGMCQFGDRCQFSHDPDWRRRPPLHARSVELRYVGTVCPNITMHNGALMRDECSLGEECPFAHSLEEVSYHPCYYKSRLCPYLFPTEPGPPPDPRGAHASCPRYYCYFAHSLSELRTSTPYTLPSRLTHEEHFNAVVAAFVRIARQQEAEQNIPPHPQHGGALQGGEEYHPYAGGEYDTAEALTDGGPEQSGYVSHPDMNAIDDGPGGIGNGEDGVGGYDQQQNPHYPSYGADGGDEAYLEPHATAPFEAGQGYDGDDGIGIGGGVDDYPSLEAYGEQLDDRHLHGRMPRGSEDGMGRENQRGGGGYDDNRSHPYYQTPMQQPWGGGGRQFTDNQDYQQQHGGGYGHYGRRGGGGGNLPSGHQQWHYSHQHQHQGQWGGGGGQGGPYDIAADQRGTYQYQQQGNNNPSWGGGDQGYLKMDGSMATVPLTAPPTSPRR